MNAPLPPFDLVNRCPKCGLEGGGPPRILDGVTGFARIDTPDPFPVEYHPEALRPPDRRPCASALDVEHLCRTCPRCAFGWAEALPQFPDAAAPVIPHVRPEVWRFALLMERELAAHHDDSVGWRHSSVPELFRLLQIEAGELCRCLQGPFISAGRSAIQIGNLSMMIADVCGALGEEGRK